MPSVFKPIAAGFMRDRITLQVPQITEPDGGGGGIYGWSDVESVWAQVQTDNNFFSYRNSSYLQEAQVAGRQIYTIIIRYNKPLTTDMRVLFRNRGLQIKSIVNVDALSWTVQLICEEERNGEYQR